MARERRGAGTPPAERRSPASIVEAERVPGKLGSGDHVHADGRAQEDRPAHERAGQRHQDVLARTRHVRWADQAAQRPDVHLFLVAVEPVCREGMGQLVQRQSASSSSPSQHAVAGSCSRLPLYASDTAVVTSWKTTKTTRAICTRTAVPNHRPRLIGDQVRKSVMVSTRGRLRSRRETSLLLSPESNLTAAAPARNATRRPGRVCSAPGVPPSASPRARSLERDRARLLN